MQNGLLTQAERYRRKQNRRRVWLRIVSALACVVVFCTTYALILPAITLEENVSCGMEEHRHDDGCYETRLICVYDESTAEEPPVEEPVAEEPPVEETVVEETVVEETVMIVHDHTDECYEEQKNLSCELEESDGHVHDESCFEQEQTLICEEEHDHTDECYETAESCVCGMEEGDGAHTHGVECYESESVLVCDIPEVTYETKTVTYDVPEPVETVPETPAPTETPAPHVHTDECYETVLVCGKTEHKHSLACYSDPYADVESESVWERSMSGVELTGVWADDLIAIAESQLGYHESTSNYEVREDGQSTKGITRYGQWYGDAYGDWCAMFVSFCLYYADIPKTAMPYEAACQRWIDELSKQEWDFYRPADEYEPVKGDLIFFDWDDDGRADHVGLIQTVEDDKLTTIEGNSSNSVRVNEYLPDDDRIQGYGVLPENPEPPVPETDAATDMAAGSEEPILPDGETISAVLYTDETCQELLDDGTVIELTGEFPQDAQVWAYPAAVETEMQVLCAWDISVRLADGSPFETEEPATFAAVVQSPLFSEMEVNTEPQVYRLAESGEPEPVPSESDETGVRFETDGASAFAVVSAAREITADEPEPEQTPETVSLSEDLLYENESFSMILHVEGEAILPVAETQESDSDAPDESDESEETDEAAEPAALSESGDRNETDEATEPDEPAETDEPDEPEEPADTDTPDEPDAAEPAEGALTVAVTEMTAEEQEYQQIESELNEGFTDGLLELSVLSLEFYWQGVPLDVSACDITAKITPQTQVMEMAEAAVAEMAADAAPEAETGVVFALMDATADGTEELDSAMVETFDGETPVLTASVNSGGLLAVAAATTANPKFTVQYYAWLDVAADSSKSSISLDVIDTSGKVLPQNGTTPALKKLYLIQEEGSSKYKVETVSTLTQVYETHEYQYIISPNLTYFNLLYENGHYSISKIWVLKEGKDAASVNEGDWNVYDPATTHFTNRRESVKEGVVLITDGTVIRLVFGTTGSTYTNAVNFYDYDITDDGTHTAQRGINSASNYSGSGAKLAFGNTNTDTGLEAQLWNGNALNRYNDENNQNYTNGNGYKGCTFGLASHLSGGKIQYSGGVIAPNLFNDGAATGKTSYDSGQYTLNFQRVSDTYTLSSVNGAGTSGLQYFNNPGYGTTLHTHIWTNNFWPMDSVSNKDGHTGEVGNLGTYTGATKTGSFPVSDDGVAHNNMFGMTYTVNFTMSEDYVGPLEYYFFGDDDMWVFLDGTLVCDIGGVHSSVGEYVNLWDYIEKGSTGSHTLSFFYTERGLSGSTCYMQFTLPSVSSITPEQNTGLLRVEKQVVGAMDSDEEFHFEIKFTDANGNNLPDDYSYTRYTANGEVVKQDVIIFDGGSFDLKAGEYIIVNYLPYGTRYTVTETNAPYYKVSYQIDGRQSVDGYTAEGQISSGKNASVVYTNTAMAVLPSTGGAGTLPYTTGGFLLMMAALLLLKKRRKGEHSTS